MKPGYKQTDVGVIPEEWEVATLKKAAEINTGINKPLSEMGHGALYVTVQDLYDGTSIRTERMGRIRVSPAELQARALEAGDIVFGKSSVKRDGIGYPSQFLGCGEPVVFSGFTYRARARHGIADASFLFYALRSNPTRRWLIDNSQASALTNINQRIADAIPVTLPPLPEQRAIAEALSDVDALLGALDRLIAKKRDLKEAAMQKLLTGQTRLPGFHGDSEIASLQQLVVKATGFWGAQSPDEGHPKSAEIIRAGDISPDGELTSTASRFLSESEFQKAQCRLDDLVITTSGNGLGKVWWCDGRANVAASNFVRVLRPIRSKAQGRFLSYVLRCDEALRQLQEHTATSAYPNLRPTFFSESWITLPPLPEQTAIAEVLTEMDAELAALEQRRKKTCALKQAMMQELLTGRTRLV